MTGAAKYKADNEQGLPESTNAHSPSSAAEAFKIAAAPGGSLRRRLDIYSSYSRDLFPETNQIYDELIQRVRRANKAGPQIGAKMPDFVLPDQDGKLTGLGSLLKTGPLVVSLNRGHWCPWCKLELRALAEIYDEVRRLNGRAVSIMPETTAYSRKASEDNNLPFPILTDLDFGFTLELGLVIRLGETLEAIYLRDGTDLPRFHSNQGGFLPIPATFVVGVDGAVKGRFVDPDFRKRMEPSEILTVLALP